MRPHDLGLGNRPENRALDLLGDPVRVLEAQPARQLEMERDLDAAAHVQHGEVMDLAHVRHPERGSEHALPKALLGPSRLDVDNDVGVGERSAKRILDAIRRCVALAHRSPRSDPDDDIGEVGSTGATDAKPPEFDRWLQSCDCAPRCPLRVRRRLIHEHVDVLAQQPARGCDDEGRDEESGDRVTLREAERGSGQARQDGERSHEIASEMERACEQSVAPVTVAGAEGDEHPGAVDRDHEGDGGERPPRGLDLELDGAGEPGDRDSGDEEAHPDEEGSLGERREVLRLRVAEGMSAVGRPDRDRDGKEREERGSEIGPRVRGLGEEPEAAAREPRDELDHDQEACRSDRDERGAPLRRHGGRLEPGRILPHVKVCPSCERENADDARFCSQCATPLEAEAPREERKVVSVLFADLVGFTSRAERMDPEDVRQLLHPYHARLRSELERHGGTVEKFIGDAVMAVFGAPTAHEDDPERAVRAALAIRESLADDELDIRIGITTGEALIALGARPDKGEGMASGDVVNTAARVQAAAPVNGILVDETTYRATERVVAYRESSPVAAKGKAEPIAAWEALEAKARFGVDVRQLGATALVGREDELETLLGARNRARREREPQLVTLVGVPGIGKSRLVWELFQHVDREPELTYWRQGRSLPYGEGVSFWALGEMVKGQAGVLETDDPERTEAKLRETVAALVSDAADANWLENHLRPLVGLEVATEAGTGRRDEAFAAWRRFLEALAEERPLVLVFEDLHWADDSLLDFVDYLVDWASGVPILVVGTARPELLSRRPGWGGGKPNALTLSLSPLSDEETARLVHVLLGRPVLEAEVQGTLLERAGGNPLYAEEFVRMLGERTDGDLPLPETVQGLIAARLDGLTADEKALLQAGAVLGKVFWLGAATELTEAERWSAEELLHALERKEFLRRERQSSVAGESEYAFRHLLVRDVAYGQIPRGVRAEKHRLAARWIESHGRPEDHAEMLAHHYLRALELSREAGQPTADIAGTARQVLEEAGDRAFSLNSYAAAVRFFDEALALGSTDDAERADVRFKRARALYLDGSAEREGALEEAREALLETGDAEHAAETDALLAEFWWHRGQTDKSRKHLDRARALVEDLPPSSGKAHVLSQVARYRMLADENEEAIRIGGDALAMAEALGLDELRAHALDNIGVAKINLDDLTGLDDLERSIEIAVAARSPEASRAYNNLGASLWMLGDLRRACTLIEEAIAVAERLGNATVANYSRIVQLQQRFPTGEWDEALRGADEFLAACEAGESHYMEGDIRLRRAVIRFARDDAERAFDDLRKALPAARRAGDPQTLVPALTGSARLLVEAGRVDEARDFALEAIALAPPTWTLIDLAWVAPELGCSTELSERLARRKFQTKWASAMRAVLRDDFAAAADTFSEIGDLAEEAFARLRAAEQLLAEGRRAEADEQLQRSLAFWRSVGATRYIRKGEALLAAAS
jgi:class 3 adenylate cyclase/tetratricopeptide (TPR) repeat protein